MGKREVLRLYIRNWEAANRDDLFPVTSLKHFLGERGVPARRVSAAARGYDAVADSETLPLSAASSPTSQTRRRVCALARWAGRAAAWFREGDRRFGVTIFSSFFAAFADFDRALAARATAFLYWRRASSAAFRAARASLAAFLAVFLAALTRRFASRDFAFSCLAVASASLRVRWAARAASIACAGLVFFWSVIGAKAYLIDVTKVSG